LHTTSLQGFGYGDVVHQFKKRCKVKGFTGISDFLAIKVGCSSCYGCLFRKSILL